MKKLFLIGLTLFLSGCSMFGPVKTDNYNTYVLDAVPYTRTAYQSNATLYVSPVAADPLYDSTGMAYSEGPHQVNYFAKNKWLDTPAKLLQPLIVQTLRNTHHFHAVTTSSAIRADYILNTKILELRQLFVCDSSYVRFRLNAEIVEARTGRIIASKQFNVKQPACMNPQSGVISANRAVAEVLRQLSVFSIRYI